MLETTNCPLTKSIVRDQEKWSVHSKLIEIYPGPNSNQCRRRGRRWLSGFEKRLLSDEIKLNQGSKYFIYRYSSSTSGHNVIALITN